MINIVCCNERKNEIIDAINDIFVDENFCFVDKEAIIHLKNDDIVIIEHEEVHKFKEIILSNYSCVYVYFKQRIFDTSNGEEYVTERINYVNEKNWRAAKLINDVLIDIDFLSKNKKNLALPDYLQIETTSYCNAKCIMCSHYFNGNKNAAHLRNTTVNNMEDAIQISRTISLNGMGEPFIGDSVSEQIDFYAKYENRIVTNTNLSVLNDELIRQINENFDWIEISCDGATKETYESIRRNLKFEDIIRNLEILKCKCPTVRKHIATVIMRQNVHELPQMVELAYKYGAKVITFMTLNANIVIKNSKDEMSNYPKVLEYYSVKAVEKGKELGIPVVVPNYPSLNCNIKFEDIQDELAKMNEIPMFKTIEDEKDMMRTSEVVSSYLEHNDEIQRDTKVSKVRCSGICDWLLKQSYIDLKGNVAMCCRNQSFHTGNVNETLNFNEVWNSEFYKKLREIFYSGYLPESCLKCGLIESGNLKYLDVEIDNSFYEEPGYKTRQKQTLLELLQGEM